MISMQGGRGIISLIEEIQNLDDFQNLNWEGDFEDYIDIVSNNPKVARSAFQRIYDMIMSYGTEEFEENKETFVSYKFFSDPTFGGSTPSSQLKRR